MKKPPATRNTPKPPATRNTPKLSQDGPEEWLDDVVFCMDKLSDTECPPRGTAAFVDWLGYVQDMRDSFRKLHAHLAAGGKRPRAWAGAREVLPARQLMLPLGRRR